MVAGDSMGQMQLLADGRAGECGVGERCNAGRAAQRNAACWRLAAAGEGVDGVPGDDDGMSMGVR